MDSLGDGVGGAVGSLDLFREAVRNTGHSIYWTDTTGRIQYVNPAFEEQTGYRADEAIGNNANILQSGEHDDRFYERLWDTILSGDVWTGEIINQRKDGDQYVVKQTISPVENEAGEIVRFVAVNEDITDLRESQQRLARERDRIAELLDAVPVPLVLASFADGAPVVKQTNQAFRDTFGFTGRELGGSLLDDLIVDETNRSQAREINERVQRGEAIETEVTRQTATDTRDFLLSTTPLGDAGRSEVLAAYIDITERNAAREELEQRTRELEKFASVVSHDLRNPLNVAMGHVDLLAEDYEGDSVETIQNAHARMQELIENILLLARQGKTIDETHPVDLGACAARSWNLLDTKDASLDVADSRRVYADSGRLRQLFGNLFRNAIEHGGPTVTVTVGLLADGFFIEDTGPGIPESDRDRVFDAGQTSTADGTGFGLSIVQEIVTAHDWSITITDGDGGGARFEITDVEFATET